MQKIFLSFVLFFCFSSIIWAGGYQVVLQGNRQTSLGNNGVGLRPDASSIFWNPGGLSFMRNSSVMLGTNPIFGTVNYAATDYFANTYTATTDNPVSTPFHVFANFKPSGKCDNCKWQFGLGIYTPFGSSAKWEDGWRGQYILQSIELQSIFFQPTVSYKITNSLGIGAGFVYAIGKVNLQKNIPIETTTTQLFAELDGKAEPALGFNVGLYFEPNEKLSLGVNYRSGLTIEVKNGDALFDVPSYLYDNFPQNNTFSASLPLPANLALGLSYQANMHWMFAVEAILTKWSDYEYLDIDFTTNTAVLNDIHSPRMYEDKWIPKFGVEYKPNEDFAVRAGFYYDPAPAGPGYITPETPSANRYSFTGGFGYRFSQKINLDMSLLYIIGEKTEQTHQDLINAGTYDAAKGTQDALEGTYRFSAIIPGFSLSYNF
ncbi:MAG: outer membrane protein transport protein [Chitinophagales bacterium]